MGMKLSLVRWSMSILLALVVTAPGAPATEAKPELPPEPAAGILRGELVSGPRAERAPGVLFLRGDDGNVLRVSIARAEVVYEAPAPGRAEHRMPARLALVPGAEVVVTALLDAASGDWNASRVEILAPRPGQARKNPRPQPPADEDEDGEDDDDPLLSAQANRRTI